MAHVFISFVEENAKLAAWIADQLRANGLEPWFAKDLGRIVPGDQWKQTLQTAIRDGGFYLPIFTKQWSDRQRTVANEELALAVDEARIRGLYRRWFIPLKADEQPLPTIGLGAGISLTDLHYVDVPQLGWERGLRVLLQALGVITPAVELGEPLAPGFGSAASITGGFLTYRNTNPRAAELEGATFTVTKGWVRRMETGEIGAKFWVRAPFEQLHNINVQLGLDSIDVQTKAQTISVDASKPTHFSYVDDKDPRDVGTPIWQLGADAPQHTNIPIEQQTGYDAIGHLTADDQIVGTFKGYVDTRSQIGAMRFTFDGDFALAVKSAVIPPDG